MNSLTGRVCIVTGAAASIGLGIAEAYARAGAKVALVDRDEEGVRAASTALKQEGWAAEGFTLDVGDRESAFEVMGRINDKLGTPYALVNAAGIVDQRPFTEITQEQMDRMMRVNVHGTLYCIQAVAALMKEQQEGRIINFSSKSGKTGSALMAHYSAAKGAVIALTQAIALELAPLNIKVNCLCPGIVDATGVWDQVSARYKDNLNLSMEEVKEQFRAKIPLNRLARIQDIVEFVLFLTESGDYCTGQALNISGGREMH